MRLGVQVDVTPALQDVDTIVDTARQDVPAIVQAAGRRYLARAQADIPTNARPRRRGRRPLATGFQVRDEVTSVRVVNVRPHAGLVAMGFQHVSGKAVTPKTKWIASAVEERERMAREFDAVLPRLSGRLRALEIVP